MAALRSSSVWLVGLGDGAGACVVGAGGAWVAGAAVVCCPLVGATVGDGDGVAAEVAVGPGTVGDGAGVVGDANAVVAEDRMTIAPQTAVIATSRTRRALMVEAEALNLVVFILGSTRDYRHPVGAAR